MIHKMPDDDFIARGHVYQVVGGNKFDKRHGRLVTIVDYEFDSDDTNEYEAPVYSLKIISDGKLDEITFFHINSIKRYLEKVI